MKQTMKSARMITMGLLTLCTMGLTNGTFAGVKTDDPVEVKFIGKIKNLPAIQLNLNNSEPGVYFINIKSMNYHILYSEIVEGTNLSRVFTLNLASDEFSAPANMVRVEVTSEKTHQTDVYNISTLTGVTENEGITKL